MDHNGVIDALHKSINVDDLNGLTATEKNGRITLTDSDGGTWRLVVVQVIPEPDHSAEDCPHKIERPETTLPAAVFHGEACLDSR